MRAWFLLILLVACAPAGARSAVDIAIGDFWKQPEFVDIQISPDGTYFGAIVPEDETRSLVIFQRKDRKVTGVARFTDKRQVGSFAWVSPTRVSFTMNERSGRLVAPQGRGEVLFMDIAGKDRAAYGGGGARGSVLTSPLRDEDDYVMVTDYVPSQRGEGGEQVLYRVNVKTAKAQRKAFSPVPGSSFLVTREGDARVASGERGFEQGEVWYRGEGDEWRKIFAQVDTGRTMTPWFMDTDGEHFYAQVSEKSGPDGLYRVGPGGEMTLVVRDAVSNPSGSVRAIDTNELLAVEFDATMPRRHYVQPEHRDAKALKSLERSFPGQWVRLLNGTEDGKTWVFLVTSDRNPGEFFIYDVPDGKATYLASVRQWIDPELMAEMKPIQFQARDGRAIHGWLTLPKGSDGKNLPLIVNPHGGPFGPYDSWGFQPEVQLFASRGYAVLQPNFRGSGGFGTEFVEAGHRQWGGTMQDDLSDATQWAIKQGIADGKRICIAGGSYGAYAALMGVVKEPDMYRCAVGFVGVYDMTVMSSRGDVSESDSGQAFLRKVLGDDDSALALASPNKQAGKIKAGVFLAAGKEDRRAPPVHTERMFEALKTAGKTVSDPIIQAGEGHGYYNTENNVNLYTRMLAFLEQHIGEGG